MPLSKLRKYIAAYNIKADGAVEKDHLIDIILFKKERNGCLPRANEEYYRKYSVPYVASPPRGLFSRIAEELNPSSSISGSHEHTARPPPPRQQPQPTFARPDLEPDHPHPQPRFAPPPGPPPPPRQPQPRYHPHPYPQPPRAAPQPQAQPPRRPASTSRSDNLAAPPPQRQRAASSSSPPVRVPPLEELLDYDNPAVGALSISTLKAILFANHVPVHAGMVLEKGELVARVLRLIQDERDEIERKRLADEQEELERRRREEEQIAQDRAAREEWRRREQEKEKQAQGEKAEGSGQAKPPPAAATAERAGLCVICQDEEANIVAMDCGHLAMCRACSELIMHSSRECPLCRTRIVTEQRLLRVFKS
ncbi:hypothetical protein PLICRDRAFT_42118 [Plicaturopsis crispa FD-325 SS-3]|nr:hypothetical protein PLICRDRAFT_42118 [Plicaturopsis crispa FD-325 SS-3]